MFVLYCYSLEWAYMAGSTGPGADGGGAGSEAGARTPSSERSQRAGHRRGASTCRATGQGISADAGVGRGRALWVPRGGGHSGRRGQKISSFQNRPQHFNHARDTSTSGTRCHELDEPVAAILKVSSSPQWSHVNQVYCIRSVNCIATVAADANGVSLLLQKLNARRHHHHQPPVHDRKEETVQEPGRVNRPVICA